MSRISRDSTLEYTRWNNYDAPPPYPDFQKVPSYNELRTVSYREIPRGMIQDTINRKSNFVFDDEIDNNNYNAKKNFNKIKIFKKKKNNNNTDNHTNNTNNEVNEAKKESFLKKFRKKKTVEIPDSPEFTYTNSNLSDENLELMPTLAMGYENSISKHLSTINRELRITGEGYYFEGEEEEINEINDESTGLFPLQMSKSEPEQRPGSENLNSNNEFNIPIVSTCFKLIDSNESLQQHHKLLIKIALSIWILYQLHSIIC